MNEIFIVGNWRESNICAYPTYDAAKKAVLEHILEDDNLDFGEIFEEEQDENRYDYDTREEFEQAAKEYVIKRIINENIFYDEYTIDSIPFMNE